MDKILGNMMEVFPSIMITTISIFIFVFYINFRFNKTSKGARESLETFVDNEVEANTSKVRPIDSDYFKKPNIHTLPIEDDDYLVKTYDEVIRYRIFYNQRRLLECSALKMIRTDKKLTNVEIKRLYGAKNLDSFTLYEQNLTNYTKSLRELAIVYIELKDYDKAIPFLDECVKLGSQSSTTYKLLARCYHEKGDNHKLIELKKLSQEEKFLKNNVFGKEKLINYIKTLK